MKSFLALVSLVVLGGCGRTEEMSKKSYEDQLAATWTTSCTEAEGDMNERHVLKLDGDGAFTFTTHRYSDEDCEAEISKFDYAGKYSIGGFVVRKGMSGRTMTMSFDQETAASLTPGESGPFMAGSTHRAIFLVGGNDENEMTEYDRDGEVLRRYHKD